MQQTEGKTAVSPLYALYGRKDSSVAPLRTIRKEGQQCRPSTHDTQSDAIASLYSKCQKRKVSSCVNSEARHGGAWGEWRYTSTRFKLDNI